MFPILLSSIRAFREGHRGGTPVILLQYDTRKCKTTLNGFLYTQYRGERKYFLFNKDVCHVNLCLNNHTNSLEYLLWRCPLKKKQSAVTYYRGIIVCWDFKIAKTSYVSVSTAGECRFNLLRYTCVALLGATGGRWNRINTSDFTWKFSSVILINKTPSGALKRAEWYKLNILCLHAFFLMQFEMKKSFWNIFKSKPKL